MNETNNNDFNNFCNGLNYVANISQLIDLVLNIGQTSNDAIMKHLLEQDKVLNQQNNVLDEQTNNYLKTIVEQNKEIIRLLKGGKNGD
jgi:preprotein translocase subunit SecA